MRSFALAAPSPRVLPRLSWSVVAALSALVLVPGLAGASGPATAPVSPAAAPALAALELVAPGASPGAVGLEWGATNDALFAGYDVEYALSSTSSSWTSAATFSSQSDTSAFVAGLTPSSSYWWKVVEQNLLGATSDSNIVEVTQPPMATLSGALAGPTSVALTWTNGATYGGSVSFGDYEVTAALGNGSFATATTITIAAERNATVAGLSTGATYRFLVRTFDRCNGAANCGSPAATSTTTSSEVTLTLPPALTVTVAPATSTVDVGAPVDLTCRTVGGAAPITYVWAFGDGATGAGANVSHAYTAPGTFAPRCTATDSLGSRASASGAVTVMAPSGGGGGGSGGGGSGNGSGNGTGGGNSSAPNGTGGSGSGGTGGPGTTNPPAGPSPVGPTATSGSLVGPLAFLVLVLVALAVIIGLALLARRRSRSTGAASAPPPGVAPDAVGPPAAPAPLPASAAPEDADPSEGGPSDLDRLFDEIGGASDRSN